MQHSFVLGPFARPPPTPPVHHSTPRPAAALSRSHDRITSWCVPTRHMPLFSFSHGGHPDRDSICCLPFHAGSLRPFGIFPPPPLVVAPTSTALFPLFSFLFFPLTVAFPVHFCFGSLLSYLLIVTYHPPAFCVFTLDQGRPLCYPYIFNVCLSLLMRASVRFCFRSYVLSPFEAVSRAVAPRTIVLVFFSTRTPLSDLLYPVATSCLDFPPVSIRYELSPSQ